MADFSISLKDTGKHSTAAGAAIETGDYNFDTGDGMANNGSEFTIQVESIDYGVNPKLDENVYRNDGNPSEINYGGAIATPVWVLRGVLDLSTSADRKIFGNLIALAKSRGYKELRTTDTSDNYYMPRYYKYNDGSTTTTAIPVRVQKLTFSQTSTSSLIRFTIYLMETD